MKRNLTKAGAVFLGALSIVIGAQLSFALPGTTVPQTAQTLAVLLTGVLLGPGGGALSVAAYVLVGLLGLPVFAGGGSGFETLFGASGGFLFGFFLAAPIAGLWAKTGRGRHVLQAFAGMALAHAVILLFGWLRLSISLGAGSAFSVGVEPFLIGAAVKSLLAAALCALIAVHEKRNGTGAPAPRPGGEP